MSRVAFMDQTGTVARSVVCQLGIKAVLRLTLALLKIYNPLPLIQEE